MARPVETIKPYKSGAHVIARLELSVQELKYVVEALRARIEADKTKSLTPNMEVAHKARIKTLRKVSQHLADKICGDYAAPEFMDVPKVDQNFCGSDKLIDGDL
ncbi:hypothetical protein D3C78_768090 [compost metagenome]